MILQVEGSANAPSRQTDCHNPAVGWNHIKILATGSATAQLPNVGLRILKSSMVAGWFVFSIFHVETGNWNSLQLPIMGIRRCVRAVTSQDGAQSKLVLQKAPSRSMGMGTTGL